jgi:hypothetical protein
MRCGQHALELFFFARIYAHTLMNNIIALKGLPKKLIPITPITKNF